MATLAPSTPHPQRPPPPSLFLGPPSRNASNVSLAPPSTSNTASSSTPPRAPLLRSRSNRAPDPSSSSPLRPQRPQVSTTQTEGDRTDALWAEMQARLAEVEVSAFSTHVFETAHAQALEELRTAQIGLAQAWGREVGDSDMGEERPGDGGEDKKDAGDEGEGNEEDILVARQRREENERVFGKVREGVRDLVGRLDEVAGAMRKVERESREIWSGSESIGSGLGSVNS